MKGNPSAWRIQASDILYEDEDLIVVDKPAGLPSQPTPDPARDNAYAAVCRYVNGGYVGMHHRLDALTSGALLFTKSERANAGISAQFQGHTVYKEYMAVSWCDRNDSPSNGLDSSWAAGDHKVDLDMPIGEIPGGKVQRYGIDGRKRRPARTEVWCLKKVSARGGDVYLCLCIPHTGRTHQIRVHLAAAHLGIIGDPLYGAGLGRGMRSIDPGRMCLHAQTLKIVHPITQEVLQIHAPRPAIFGRFLDQASKLGQV